MSSEVGAQFPSEAGSRGEFIRQHSHFREWVSNEPGAKYPAETGRYHLYVSLACPWASRAVIVRKLKGLEDAISMSVVDPIRDDNGWAFREGPGFERDPLGDHEYLSEIYLESDPQFRGRVTVPVLFDKQARKIVNNESSEIIRMLNSEFNEFGDASIDLYPEELRGEIDEVNGLVYPNINNGVYRCGFAARQEAYEEAFWQLFSALDQVEQRLAGSRYLVGDTPTEADWRLFTTLVRFDPVYVGHFKCNLRRLIDYPNLWGYTRDLYQQPGIAETVNFDHIKRHYYMTHRQINPTGVVPAGPELNFEAPHNRAEISS